MLRHPFLLLLLITGINAFAQKESNTWYFGLNAGINFNTNPPTVITDGQTNTREGVSCISGSLTGKLLFYSEGTTVWDRNHNVMPNGKGLLGDYSSTQSSIAIPDPANRNRYYLFTTALDKGMRYSQIDITLNKGNGDVIAHTKNTLLIPSGSSSEKLIAVKHCNNKDYWVVTHKLFSSTYMVYLVDASGVHTPLSQNIGAHIGDGDYWEGTACLKFSSDGRLLANAIGPAYSGALSNVEVLNFNDQTGRISGPVIQLTGLNSPYGVEFSSQKKYLYVSENLGKTINQYDLTAGNINASKKVITTSLNLNFGALQMGPDGRIYVAAEDGYNTGASFLGTIDRPDAAGKRCKYVQKSIALNKGSVLIGLPAFVAGFLQEPHFANIKFSSACAGQAVPFSYSGNGGIKEVRWDFGDSTAPSKQTSPKHIYAAAGKFNITFIAYRDCNNNDTVIKTINIADCSTPAPPILIKEIQEKTSVTGSVVNNDTIPLASLTDTLPEKRDKKIIKTIEVEQDSVTVILYDNAEIDGDSVTLVYNDSIITRHQRLSEKAISFTLRVGKDVSSNELLMYAENLGSIPPNTALMIIYDGQKRYEVNISSSKETNGVVVFRLKR